MQEAEEQLGYTSNTPVYHNNKFHDVVAIDNDEVLLLMLKEMYSQEGIHCDTCTDAAELKERQAGQRRMPVFARDGSAFQKIMHRIRLVAATDMSVMIFGENGTGKEHIAHHLHDKSKRAVKPFVAVDCGSLTKELAPSAFFGHVKGAFTGADCAKKGYFHEAEGGTLFLDEVGNLALETQQMLLRAIQERRYRPVGDKADRSFNVRIIAMKQSVKYI
jgi:two-component system, NtrC family, response regulator HydG